ncbi:MAG: putative acetyltransferase [Lentisphaerae bacterium ADurb.Bin242]|nr:MAG: putative acetyltransferase [Lentisphaerae bacterium ADurb.Bin242]
MIRIRKFKAGDAEPVAAIMFKAFKSFLGTRIKQEDFTAEYYRKTSNLKASHSETVSFVAHDGEKVVGYLKVAAGNNGLGSLESIGIAPEYFSKGIGSMLFAEADKFWQMKKMRKISTCVSAHNRKALIYYIKNGFIPEGYRRDHFFEGVDEIILGRFMKKA